MRHADRDRLEKRKRALGLAAADMQQVNAATIALEREAYDVPLMLALETAIAVSYARSFTSSSLLQLDRGEYRPADPSLAQLHDDLYELRNRKFAHTDKNSERDAWVLYGDPPVDVRSVGWKWQWTPIPRSWLAPIRTLCELQSERFVQEMVAIDEQLQAAADGSS
jgi:hypothetical protein